MEPPVSGGASAADARQVLKQWLANHGAQDDAEAARLARQAQQQRQDPSGGQHEGAAVELVIAEQGKLGLGLGPAEGPAAPALQIVSIAADGLAARAAEGRLRVGMVVAAVGGSDCGGAEPSAVLGRIKAAGRPLALRFATPAQPQREGGALRVLSDLPLVHSHLRHPAFTILPHRQWDGTVSQLESEGVDVLFVGRHVADFQQIPRRVLVNQVRPTLRLLALLALAPALLLAVPAAGSALATCPGHPGCLLTVHSRLIHAAAR
eukprot:COSAG04_NODE_20_length_39202_cov_9.993530_13_plen_264_part_00